MRVGWGRVGWVGGSSVFKTASKTQCLLQTRQRRLPAQAPAPGASAGRQPPRREAGGHTLEGTRVRYSAGMIWSVSMFCRPGVQRSEASERTHTHTRCRHRQALATAVCCACFDCFKAPRCSHPPLTTTSFPYNSSTPWQHSHPW